MSNKTIKQQQIVVYAFDYSGNYKRIVIITSRQLTLSMIRAQFDKVGFKKSAHIILINEKIWRCVPFENAYIPDFRKKSKFILNEESVIREYKKRLDLCFQENFNELPEEIDKKQITDVDAMKKWFFSELQIIKDEASNFINKLNNEKISNKDRHIDQTTV